MIQKGFTSCLSVLPKRIPCSIYGCSSASLTAIRSREQHLGHLAATPSRSLHTSKATLSAQSTNANKNTTPTTDPFKLKPIPPTGETVELDFELYQPPQNAKSFQTDAKAIVVCHGLFGSKQNWRSLGRSMAQQFNRPVYAVDLRNHGTSPHTEGMNYVDMASDLIRFFKQHDLERVALVGHSMGGKTVQALALSSDLPSETLSHLISVDMSPARGPLSKEFEGYVEAMLKIESDDCKSRNEADEILQNWESEIGVRQFLLTNLHRIEGSEFWTFRIPVKTIQNYLPQIGDFPYDPPEGISSDLESQRERRSWQGKILFVKGKKSKYINRRNIPVCDQYFPKAQHVVLETGHWVQAEDPRGFMKVLEEFLRKE